MLGSNITFSETLIIALSGIAVVLAILVCYAISLVIKLTKIIADVQKVNTSEPKQVADSNAAAQNYMQSFDDVDDEEDRLVVALAASAMAASDKSNSHFHISKITRIK